jgi:hypothetical protein
LLLGAHQFVEAAVWHADGGSGPATVAWAVIALPVLALWVPWAVWCAAPYSAPRTARRRLVPPVAIGTVTAAVLAYDLATGPVRAEIRGHTIGYAFALTHAPVLVAGYLLATLGALLLSTDRRLRTLGAVLTAGAALCWALWRLEFVSTWCALAAVCSVLLLDWTRTRADSNGVDA